MPTKVPLHDKDGSQIEVAAERVSANGVTFPWEYNPHRTRLWVLGNEYGPMGAVWADSMEEAFDELVDADLAAGILMDEDDAIAAEEEMGNEVTRLGNAGEPVELSNAWAWEAKFDLGRDCKVLCAFAEARGSNADTLDDFYKANAKRA